MCLVLSSAHPDYRLIIIGNNNGLIDHPTSLADWWSTNPNILSARDHSHSNQTISLGITKQGRLAALIDSQQGEGKRDHHAIVEKWLETSQATTDFVEKLKSSDVMHQMDGSDLICGYVNQPLAVFSRRSHRRLNWIMDQQGQTVGIRGRGLGDQSSLSPEMLLGRLLEETITGQIKRGENEEDLVASLFDAFTMKPLPRMEEASPKAYQDPRLQNVFIPAVGQQATAGHRYATQKQTVVLVGFDGRVRYIERTLDDESANAIPGGKQDRSFEFMVER